MSEPASQTPNYAKGGNGSILFTIWEDMNGTGLVGNKEKGLGNVRIILKTLTDEILGEYESNEEGSFQVDNLPDGEYVVCIDETSLPENYLATFKSDLPDQNRKLVDLTGRNKQKNVDLGFRPPVGSIGDRIWFDANEDGTQDEDEPGIAGVTVRLKDIEGNEIRSIETNSKGNYRFLNLPKGDYIVSIDESTLPENILQTYNLDPNLLHGARIALESGQHIDTVDFGYILPPLPVIPPINIKPKLDFLGWLGLYWHWATLISLLSLVFSYSIFYIFYQSEPTSPVIVSIQIESISSIVCGADHEQNVDVVVRVNDYGERSIDEYHLLIGNNKIDRDSYEIEDISDEITEIRFKTPLSGNQISTLIQIDQTINSVNQDPDELEINLNNLIEDEGVCVPDLEISMSFACIDNYDSLITATVTNSGNVAVNESIEADINGNIFKIEALEINEEVIFEITLQNPNGDIYAEVDPQNLISEKNQNNNRTSITITDCSPPPDPIDLSLSFEACVEISGGFSLKINIQNLGNISSGAFIVQIEDKFVDIDSIQGNQTYTIDHQSSTFEPVKVIIDSDNQVIEADETNNSIEIDIDEVCEFPPQTSELDISLSIDSSDELHCESQPSLIAKARVRNSGTKPVQNIIVQIGDKTRTINELGPDEEVELELQFDRPISRLSAYVDPENLIEEINENNNSAEVEVQSLNLADCDADLVVAVSPACANGAEGTQIQTTLMITNIGDGDASNFFALLNGRILNLQQLASGQSYQHQFNFPADTSNFIAEVDITNSISEKNESNNISNTTLLDHISQSCINPDKRTCTRFNMDIGRNKVFGSPSAGTFVMHESTGRRLVSWYAQKGWLDSGWLRDIDISHESVHIGVTFYPAFGGSPIELEIINHAPNSKYGWLTRDQCHAIEIQFPV